MQEAVSLLRTSILETGSSSSHLLLCRSFYAEDLLDEALAECETAATTPSSEAFLWLGRVYGAKASRANPLSALALARKVHTAFARALVLDPGSVPAMNDLGEFYVKAPGIVGGSIAQARTLAERAAAISPLTQHRLLGLIARKQKDLAAAEEEFKAGVDAASPDLVAHADINLAQFYRQTAQDDRALQAIHAAIAADRDHDAGLVDAASILEEIDREPTLAIQCLRDYLVSPARSDAAPAFKVHLQLADLLVRAGELTAAREERATAFALAPDFVPARQVSPAALQSHQLR